LGLAVTAAAGTFGADRAGIVGVAFGMTVGYAAVFALTSASAVVPFLGWSAWAAHLARLGAWFTTFMAASLLTAHVPLGIASPWADFAARAALLFAWLLPVCGTWAYRHYANLEARR
jgi:hypothetical protein